MTSHTEEEKHENEKLVYAVVGNIPKDYRSSDLRNFFSQFLEPGGFDCFHFRHRPQVTDGSKTEKPQIFCCVIRLQACKLVEMKQMYHRKHWLDRKGESLMSVCTISKINTSGSIVQSISNDSETPKYQTKAERKLSGQQHGALLQSDLTSLSELNPPNVMPNGNVGTPTKIFLRLIQECKLPPSIIKKLDLTFPKTRAKRKYGSVFMDYGDYAPGIRERSHEETEETEPQEGSTSPHTRGDDQSSDHGEDGTDHDDDSCEEWERHEANVDDPANYERNKDRVFEEELEVTWEKGGSGLVFYTDAQHWREQEGDFDEQTADDWDVDYSGYYEPGGGDKDARDYITMRQEQRRRRGEEATDMYTAGFGKCRKEATDMYTARISRRRKEATNMHPAGIGKFEKHTKGIGHRILRKQGWSEGKGLGSSIQGISEALDNDGQNPKDRTGLGYYGEKINRYVPSNKKRKPQGPHLIGTIYDDPGESDPPEPLLRRQHPHTMRHRDGINFQKATDHE